MVGKAKGYVKTYYINIPPAVALEYWMYFGNASGLFTCPGLAYFYYTVYTKTMKNKEILRLTRFFTVIITLTFH